MPWDFSAEFALNTRRHLLGRRNKPLSDLLRSGDIKKFLEETMNKLAIAMLLLASPAFAQSKDVAPDALRDCPPTGQTAKGELVYSLDCKALKAENRDVNYKPDMPATRLPDTVIPKSGATQTPETTPTKAK
jgi:hypothetical protein